MNELIEAFKIFIKYDEDASIEASHEIIYAIPEEYITAERDIIRLKELGWFVQDDCWTHYV